MSHRRFGRTGWSWPVAIGLAVVGLVAAATPASAETLTYGPNSTLQPFHHWTVPAGVCGATFDLFGAEGSGGVGGAHVTSTLAVKPGTAYDIYVGGWGTRGNGGYNGGGDASGQGNNEGVGGGGATDVRTGPGLADRILVAGGGGGNGGGVAGPIGGAGGQGGLVGQSGTKPLGDFTGGGGGGGTATAGGALGLSALNVTFDGKVGRLGVGGDGGYNAFATNVGFGGGGGGGLYGGGGGGGGQDGGGGGGGGSSLAAGGTVSATSGGNGKAVITYTASPTCSQAGGQTPGGGAADQTKPTLGGLTFSRTSFRAASSGASASARRKAVGTKVSFSLSEASRVNFSVERPVAGRKVNGTCVRPKRSNRGKRSCTRWVTVRGSFGVTGAAGENAFTFRGRVGGKSLKPGSYRLTGQATDSAGNASLLRRRGFEIVQ
jgi:hypothetical protein